jgi:uncharacterized membrane protein
VSKPSDRLSSAVRACVAATAALNLASSARVRGGRRTAVFFALGAGLPTAAEFLLTDVFGVLRHNVGPKVRGVPVTIPLFWYGVNHASFSIAESALDRLVRDEERRREYLPLGAAAVATSLDLLLDCYGLDQGLWEWSDGGAYAGEIEGANGEKGIPLLNFYGWVNLVMGVALFYQLAARKGQAEDKHPSRTSKGSAPGRTAAVLSLLPSYLAAAGWAIKNRKFKYLAYSALFPLSVTLALCRVR